MNRRRIEDAVLRRNHDLQIAPFAGFAEVLNPHLPRRGGGNALQIRHGLGIIRRCPVVGRSRSGVRQSERILGNEAQMAGEAERKTNNASDTQLIVSDLQLECSDGTSDFVRKKAIRS